MKKLNGYTEVADRIPAFYAMYPEGSIRTERVELVQVGGKDFVKVSAAVYRGPDDQLPCVGTAMDPIPGTSNFTRNSEVENCETSAWGRALAALGFGGKSIASVEEINVKKQLTVGNSHRPARVTAADVAALAKDKKMPVDVLKSRVADLLGTDVDMASMLDLDSEQLSQLKAELEAA
jgi:hypothetical protein